MSRVSKRMTPFPRRRSRKGISPVISTILLVAITVVLAGVLFVLVSSINAGPPAPPISIQFSSEQWNAGSETTTVLGATGAGAVPVGTMTFVVKAADGEPYFGGKSNETKQTNGVNVTVSYLDLDHDDRITTGDQVVIAVQPQSGATLLEGGVVELYTEGRQIASHGI